MHNETQIRTLSNVADGPEWTGSQQLRIAYQNSILSLTAGVFCAFIIVILLWPVSDNRGLILWLGTVSVLTMLRLILQQRYVLSDSNPKDYSAWHNWYVASACASGCIWGALSVFLFPHDSILHVAYMTFVIGGVCAGAVAVYSPVKNAFTAFSIPVLLPFAISVWGLGRPAGPLMSCLVAAFSLILIRSANQSRKNVQDVLDLQVVNAGLTRALHHRATHDSLVDLVNHGEFNRRLDKAANEHRGEGSEYSLIFLDLDLFKAINDTSGHAAGDLILKGVANVLKRRTRESDTVARVGGDEFAVLLKDCPNKRAVEIAEHIRQDIAALRIEYDGTVHSIGASIGVSYGQTGMHNATSMLKAADAACYEAKKEGRNRVCANPASGSFHSTGRFELTDPSLYTSNS